MKITLPAAALDGWSGVYGRGDAAMQLIAIMPVRNEDWILGFSARVALKWCDGIVFLNHASTDESRRIMEEIAVENPGRVLIADQPRSEWREMEHRQHLLTIARQQGATHIALVDADEVLTANSLGLVRPAIEALQPREVLNVNMFCMWRGLHQYRTDPASVWSNRRDLALAFCDSPRLEWAAAVDGYQHHARAPRHSRPRSGFVHGLGVMHLQFANWRRLKAKHALYKVNERIAYPERNVAQIEAMYNQALDERGIQVAATPDWFSAYHDLRGYIDLKAEPWQEAAVKVAVEHYGTERFAGLNLFGLA